MAEVAIDPLEMTDEEFANLPDSYFEEQATEDTGDDNDAGDNSEGADDDELDDTDSAADSPEVPGLDDEGEDDDDEDDDAGDLGDDADSAGDDSGDDADDDGDDGDAADGDESEEGDDTGIDYKAAYEQLLSSFRANGTDMKVDSVDEARRLMQMGANYNKKMQGLKPNLKILKTLEKAEITEDKLNYLIDLDKKDPAAIARLVKESGLEPLEIDVDQADDYKAANHAASDREVALDAVIDEIKDSPHYNQVLDLVASKWDAQSQQAAVDQPQLLKLMNDHMASGIYDLISPEMEKQRMLGELEGMSDLEAYRSVGDAIQARRGFDHLFQPEQGQQKPKPSEPTPREIAESAKRKDKRRAASSPKTAAPSAPPADFNPLSMSDEEFEKQFPG